MTPPDAPEAGKPTVQYVDLLPYRNVWRVELSCGHDEYITGRKPRIGSRRHCSTCVAAKLPIGARDG